MTQTGGLVICVECEAHGDLSREVDHFAIQIIFAAVHMAEQISPSLLVTGLSG
jgi:hypothetical protein